MAKSCGTEAIAPNPDVSASFKQLDAPYAQETHHKEHDTYQSYTHPLLNFSHSLASKVLPRNILRVYSISDDWKASMQELLVAKHRSKSTQPLRCKPLYSIDIISLNYLFFAFQTFECDLRIKNSLLDVLSCFDILFLLFGHLCIVLPHLLFILLCVFGVILHLLS